MIPWIIILTAAFLVLAILKGNVNA